MKVTRNVIFNDRCVYEIAKNEDGHILIISDNIGDEKFLEIIIPDEWVTFLVGLLTNNSDTQLASSFETHGIEFYRKIGAAIRKAMIMHAKKYQCTYEDMHKYCTYIFESDPSKGYTLTIKSVRTASEALVIDVPSKWNHFLIDFINNNSDDDLAFVFENNNIEFFQAIGKAIRSVINADVLEWNREMFEYE